MPDHTDDTMPDFEDTSALGALVLESTQHLLARGRARHDDIGRRAWQQLTEDERTAEFPHLLTCYVSRILAEERERAAQTTAADPDVTSHLGLFDEVTLWDAVLSTDATPDAEVTVDRQALLNVLSELELLRHRLSMASAAK